MSVIIENMEMPRSCFECPLARFSLIDDGEVYCVVTNQCIEANTGTTKRRKDCPLRMDNRPLAHADNYSVEEIHFKPMHYLDD